MEIEKFIVLNVGSNLLIPIANNQSWFNQCLNNRQRGCQVNSAKIIRLLSH
jgi:hypothetical protein